MQRRDLHVPGRNASLEEARDRARPEARAKFTAPGRRADPPARAKLQRRAAAPR